MANLSVSMENQSEKKIRLSSSRRYRNRRAGEAYAFLLPYILFMLAFGLGPGIYALIISFADYSSGLPRYFAAGIKNYLTVFKDSRFGFTFKNIGEFLLISVPIGIVTRGATGVAPAHAARESCIHPADTFFHSRCSCRPGCGAAGHIYVDPECEPIWVLA